MAGARAAACIGELGKHIDHAREGGHGEAVAQRRRALGGGEGGGQRLGGERGAGRGLERLHPHFLGPVVFLIIVAARAGPAGAATERLPVRGLVPGAAIQRGIDKGLDEVHRVAMHAGEVGAQARGGETEQPAREIGAADVRQEEKAAVLGDEVATAFALFARPAQPLVAHAQVQARTAVTEQRQPLAVLIHGDVAQHGADERRVVQVMVLLDQFVPARQFGRVHQLKARGAEQMLLGFSRENPMALASTPAGLTAPC